MFAAADPLAQIRSMVATSLSLIQEISGAAFTEQRQDLSAPRALLTMRACWWAIGQLRREHASIAGLARQLGASWRTVWRAITPLLKAMDADPGGSRPSQPWESMNTSGTTSASRSADPRS